MREVATSSSCILRLEPDRSRLLDSLLHLVIWAAPSFMIAGFAGYDVAGMLAGLALYCGLLVAVAHLPWVTDALRRPGTGHARACP